MNNDIAFVLDKESSEKLKQLFPPKHPNTYYHHITMAHRPDDEVFQKYEKYIGQNLTFKVTKHCFDEKGQAVIVDTDLSEYKHPHVTLSCAKGIIPVYSHELLDKEDITCEDVELEISGEVQVTSF